MNKAILTASFTAVALIVAGYLLNSGEKEETATIYRGNKPRKKKTMSERAFFSQQRVQYEYDMLKDGGTGRFPAGIHDRELSFAKRLPVKEAVQRDFLSPFADNSYTPAGPENFGGRTRSLAFDKRFGTGGNQVILAGAISGGIYRSTNGGTSWTNVTPENEIHNVSAIAQDTRTGQENTWYAGGGEALGNSASPAAGGAFYLGNGLFKSTDNGASWQRLTTTFQGNLEVFDAPFDIVHKIVVNPINGHVYVAAHRRLMRSTNGGTSFEEVFAGSQAAAADNGQMDVTITNTGRIYIAVNGGFADQNRRGLWFSETGNLNSWTRFAGGQTLNSDSIAGWRGNSYTNSGALSTASKRILLALAPSNNNILYAMYENGLSQEGASGSPEADLFKFDFTASTFTNLSANMPNLPGQRDGVDPLA
ncbi:sialidase family protein, partial [Flavihumibacter sp. CACIAM 22H1]|uniref:WD40/YVTN/BNR-like repeat-containing protein n=1 Tax=Flavihumibacter sp. CACIAM 22H1 TaxID=1812911 RepID=UPI0025BA9394